MKIYEDCLLFTFFAARVTDAGRFMRSAGENQIFMQSDLFFVLKVG